MVCHHCSVLRAVSWTEVANGVVGEPVPIVQCHGIISPGIPFWSVSIVFLGAAMLVTGKLPRSPPLCVLINRISSGTRRGLNSSL